MKLMFVGPPGAGKGTQAVAISEKLGIVHISTGDMLREEMKNATELGMQAKAYIDAGDLVPDDVIIGMVRQRISRPDAGKGFILDGFPRTVVQAEALEGITKLDKVFNIDADDEALVRRICGRRVCKGCAAVFQASQLSSDQACRKCGGVMTRRDDDNEETVRQRLSVYKRKTKPLIDFYTQRGLLYNVVSESIADTTDEIMAVLSKMK